MRILFCAQKNKNKGCFFSHSVSYGCTYTKALSCTLYVYCAWLRCWCMCRMHPRFVSNRENHALKSVVYISARFTELTQWLNVEGQRALRFHPEYLNLVSEDGTTWVRVINNNKFKWTVSLIQMGVKNIEKVTGLFLLSAFISRIIECFKHIAYKLKAASVLCLV